MPDLPPLSPLDSGSRPEGGDAGRVRYEPSVHDAVFEDIEFADTEIVPSEVMPPVDVPAPPDPAERSFLKDEDPFEDVPLSGDSVSPPLRESMLGYDAAGGFRIDFDDDAPRDVSAALARVPRTLPATQTGGGGESLPPGPPAPPAARAEARRAARDRLRILRRHRWLILATTLLGLGLAALASVLAGPTYTAYSILLVNADRPTGGDGAAFLNAPGEAGTRVLNQAIVLQQNPEIAQRTAVAILARPDAPALSTVQDATDFYETLGLTPETYAEYLQDEIVSVSRAEEDVDAIRVEADASQPEEAALIARLYTDQYQALTRASNRQSVTQTREILEEQIARRRGELDEVERQLEGYMTSRNAAGLDAQTTTTVGQIGQLQAQLDLARVEAQTRQAQLAQLQADLASVPRRLDAASDAPSVVETTQLDADIERLETLLEQAYAQNPQYRGNPSAHPDLQRLNSRLEASRAERRRLANVRTDAAVAAGGLDVGSVGTNGPAYVADLQRQIAQTRAALEGARAQAAALASSLGEARGTLRDIPSQEVRLAQLQRQRATTAATLAQLQREYDSAQLAETTELGFAQVVREVQVPRRPSSPNVPLNLALGTLLGLLAGLALAFVRYQTDSHARTPDDLVEHGFTVVGTVPDVTDALRVGRQEVEGLSVHSSLVAVTRPFAPEAEAFRHLHAALSAADAPQVVLVGGPDVGSGKSTVAANLGAVAAQAGRRVLLVDADLRDPELADLLGLGLQPPLGEGPGGTNLVYWSTSVPGLFAMTPRAAAESPDQMWAPHQIGTLVRNLRGAFDLVLIDTPSALTSAAATLLAPHADAAILIAEADRTDLDALTQVATEFVGVGLTRIGAVLNRFDATKTVGFQATAGVRHAPRD